METKNLSGANDLPNLDWAGVTANLSDLTQAPDTGGPNRHSCWLTTINADGSPHMTAVGAQWHDDAWWFETGPGTRKARNVTKDPRCALSVSTHEYDVTVEGNAVRETDPGKVAELAQIWRDGGWPCEVDETGIALTAPFTAPSGGPAPWFVYRITPRSATALMTVAPGGATRWTF